MAPGSSWRRSETTYLVKKQLVNPYQHPCMHARDNQIPSFEYEMTYLASNEDLGKQLVNPIDL